MVGRRSLTRGFAVMNLDISKKEFLKILKEEVENTLKERKLDGLSYEEWLDLRDRGELPKDPGPVHVRHRGPTKRRWDRQNVVIDKKYLDENPVIEKFIMHYNDNLDHIFDKISQNENRIKKLLSSIRKLNRKLK